MRDNTKENVPYCIVGEAPRYGTTGLRYSLGLRPSISMSRPEEPVSSHVNGSLVQTR
jgi:hypothetical protein